jgi:hypothetical protein
MHGINKYLKFLWSKLLLSPSPWVPETMFRRIAVDCLLFPLLRKLTKISKPSLFTAGFPHFHSSFSRVIIIEIFL